MDMLVMAFHMGDRFSDDFYACDVITDLLSNGHSSRLNQRLVKEQKIFNSIDAYISGSADPGLLHIIGRLNPGVSLSDAEATVWSELEMLRTIPVGAAELEKVRNRFESERIFGQISYLNIAIRLAQLTLFNTTPEQEITSYRSVTAEEVQATARRIFTKKNSNIIYYRAKAFSV
jgi:predicted Zn-dependent peptidase